MHLADDEGEMLPTFGCPGIAAAALGLDLALFAALGDAEGDGADEVMLVADGLLLWGVRAAHAAATHNDFCA